MKNVCVRFFFFFFLKCFSSNKTGWKLKAVFILLFFFQNGLPLFVSRIKTGFYEFSDYQNKLMDIC